MKFMPPNTLRGLVLLILLAMMTAGCGRPPTPAGKAFATPKEAADALISAAEKFDMNALREIYGPEGDDLLSSGDPVQDKNYAEAFAKLAKEKTLVMVDPNDSTRAILSVGALDWPMPVPIVRRKGKWYFDVAEGRDEILHRRIGANELDALQVCRGYVEAQHEYADMAVDEGLFPQYAQRIISTPGKRDGLYWQSEDGTPGGPITEAVARAIEEGYTPNVSKGFHGYYFKVLKGQGPAAPMGELDYVIKGIMIGGFALIAVPAEYGVSGIKTFIVNHDGIVYEKDLGPKSLDMARQIERYNPDKTWTRTDDEWPSEDSN